MGRDGTSTVMRDTSDTAATDTTTDTVRGMRVRTFPTVDWRAQVRLAAIVSVAAAIAAVALAGFVPEAVIVVGVIVLATMASWYQLEIASAPGAYARRR
jgi:Mg/Co/Ni transporter MgtE